MTREEAIKHGEEQLEIFGGEHKEFIEMAIKALEQEPRTVKWCTDCREYDQEKHCCHRWSRAIRDTVEEMKQYYIERDVLDKIRAEIEQLSTSTYTETRRIYINADDFKENVLAILDKYMAESEE